MMPSLVVRALPRYGFPLPSFVGHSSGHRPRDVRDRTTTIDGQEHQAKKLMEILSEAGAFTGSQCCNISILCYRIRSKQASSATHESRLCAVLAHV
jgi:hypothetical protein